MGEMQETSDAQLLRDYAGHGTESAFREIVTRHADFVYSAALRQVNSSDLARDLTQGVFCDLARKARQVAEKMTGDSSLAGWLGLSDRSTFITDGPSTSGASLLRTTNSAPSGSSCVAGR